MTAINQQLQGRVHTTAIAALEVVPFAMLITDRGANALAVNQRWMTLAGVSRVNSLGAGWLSVLDPEARTRLREDVIRVANEDMNITADYQLVTPSRARWARWWISRHELDGTPLVAIAAADVDDDYARQANLYHLATHDALTGLINRNHFLESIDQALRRNQRMARHVGVVYVDLDGFKQVNDRGGHRLGDRVLFAIGARLRHAVRSADLVARIGGDEFAVLCEGLTAAEQAEVVARRVEQALAESVELDGEQWSVAASVGAAVDEGGPDTAENLVDRADRAMYSIKQGRRGPFGEADATGGTGAASAATALLTRASEFEDTGGARVASEPPEAPSASGGATTAESPEHTAGQPGTSGPGGEPGPDTGRVAPAAEWKRTSEVPVETPAGADGPDHPDAGIESSAGAGTEARHEPTDQTAAEAPPLAEAPEAGSPQPEDESSQPEDESPQPEDESRGRLAQDVVTLRESIDSIRRMLDRLMAPEPPVIDIRDKQEAPESD